MRRKGMIVIVLCSILATSAFAQSQARVAKQQNDGQAIQASSPMTPLSTTINAIRNDARQKIASLQAGMKGVKGQAQLDLMKQIQQLKMDAQIAVTRAVLEDARIQGDTHRIQEAELALDNLLHPEKYRTQGNAKNPTDR